MRPTLVLVAALAACSTASAPADGPTKAPSLDFDTPSMVDIPDHLDVAEVTVPGAFVLELTDDAAAEVALAGPRAWTGRSALETALAEVGADGVRRVHASAKGASAEVLGLHRTLRFDSAAGIDAVVDALGGIDGVAWVQPVGRGEIQWRPNDDLLGRQWNMAELNLEAAWDIARGEGVVVAVVDTGVDPSGPDGLGRYIGGRDIVRGDDDPNDGNGHGTHVAGTINQATDNGIGAVGVAPDASVMAIKAVGDDGSGSTDDVADGIVWAVDNGADIINLSLGFGWNSRVLEDAVEYAAAEGVLLVAATGNEGYSSSISYPARYDEVIAVGATGRGMSRVGYSNEGRQLELMAPGGDLSDGDGILQETFSFFWWDFLEFEGTSMASPHVAGVAALVMSAGVRDPDEVRAILQDTAVDLGAAGRDNTYGYGFVDALAAVEAAGGEPIDPDPADPCDGYLFAVDGSLGLGEADVLPPSGYYYRSNPGIHDGYLEGPDGTDFDLYLYRWDGADWAIVGFSESYSSIESITEWGEAGYYQWVVNAYSGSGGYDFCVTVP